MVSCERALVLPLRPQLRRLSLADGWQPTSVEQENAWAQ